MSWYKIKKKLSVAAHIDLFLLDVVENKNIDLKFIPLVQLDDIRLYKKKLDRDKRLLARSFLFSFLNEHYGIVDFDFDFNEYERPFLKKETNINFTFSYANSYVLIGISRDKKIGVDIEYINSKLNMSEIAPDIMCASELKKFSSYSDSESEQSNYFFKLFSAKESIIKAFGTGLNFDVKEISILDSNQFTYENVNFTYKGLGVWMNQYTLAVCFEK